MTVGRDALSIELGAIAGPVSDAMQQCVRAGNLLFTSGHTSLQLGKVGADLTTRDGAVAAREAALRLLYSVREAEGSLEGLSPVQVNVCINASPDFTQHGDVAEGASCVLREVFGSGSLPTRKALGMSSLPRGVAVEIDAVFAIVDRQ